MCKRILKSQTSEKGDVPFFKIGTFGKEPDAFISHELFEEYRRLYSFPKVGDIIVSAAGTIGRIAVFDGKPAYFQDSNLIWIDNDNSIIDNSFLAVAYPRIKWAISSTTIARIYNETVRQTTTTAPYSILEQCKIGEFFNKLEAMINEVDREIARFEKMKQASLQKMFPRPGATVPEIRFSGFSDKWRYCTLNEICTYRSSSLKVSDAKRDGKYVLYDANNPIGYIDYEPVRSEYVSIIKDGAGVGRCRLLPKDTFIIGTLGAIIPKNNCNINFLYNIVGNLRLGEKISGSTIPHIYFSEYGLTQVQIPSYEEQDAIGRYLKNLDSLLSAKRQKRVKLLNIKQACLDKMFVNISDL